MKKIFLVLMTAAAFHAGAQQFPMYSKGMSPVSYSDPAVSNLQFTTANGAAADADHLLIGTPIRLSFTMSNNDAINAVPAGTCQLKITLGSKFRLAAGDDISLLASFPMDDYFRWNMIPALRNSQFIITGELIRDLPARFNGQVAFTLMPSRNGSSTVTAQLMVSNHDNPVTVLSDIAPMNNFISKTYSNAKPLGIKFLQFNAFARGCNAELNWMVFDEDQMTRRFLVETSGDGINFVPVKNTVATGGSSYTVLLDNLSAKNMTFRIKAEDNRGGYVYSAPVTLNNLCNGKFEVGLFPNPMARDLSELTLTAKQGIFNGKYSIKLTDAAGKELKRTEGSYTNQVQVKFTTGAIPSGAYFLYVTGEDGKAMALPFVKQ